jgi:Right handed beta helix region
MTGAALAVQIVVAPSGSDVTGDGTEAKPFAGLERARDAARVALHAGQPVQVVLHAGTYVLKNALELGPEDSGTAAAPAVWSAAPGEAVRLCGGPLISGWKPVTDPAIRARLDPVVRDRVLQIDLKTQGITDYGDISGGFAKQGTTGLELFVDDVPMQISRYPNHGFIKIAKVLGPTPFNVRGHKGTKEGIFRVDDPRVARWAQENDPRAMGYWCWDWADEREKIASIDPQKLVITLSPPWHGFGYTKGQYFCGFNLLCEIDEPGEWYLDRKSGILYLLPPGDVAPRRAMVSVVPNLVTINKAAHVVLQNLIFEGCREKAITITDSEDCRVEDCTIRNLGSWAVWVTGGKACAVERCSICGTGDGGVWLQGGDRATLTPANHLVENCDIHDYARWDRTYQPGVHLDGVGLRAAHNEIHNAPHQAISFMGNDHVIEFNDIHDVCQETNDAGAIYAWNDWAGRGHRISNNYIHDVMGYKNKGANGIYLDDNYSAALIFGNVFKNVKRAIHLGGGRNHRVVNNLFVDCTHTLHIDARGLGWRAYGFDELKQKLQLWPYQKPPWSERYPELVHILDEEPMAPRGVVVSNNIFVSCNGDEIEPKAKPYLTMKQNVLDAPSSVLVAPVNGIPQIDPANPLFHDVDFQQIPDAQIGIIAKKN